jgi:ferric-dicitrate binding protein FerR (iron transport regulator)
MPLGSQQAKFSKMPATPNQIYEIIARELTGTVSPEETQILESWIAENIQNQLEYEDIRMLWEQTEEFVLPNRIDQKSALNLVHHKAAIKTSKTFRLHLFYQVAAILVLAVLLAGTYNYLRNSFHSKPIYYEEVHAAAGTRTHVDLPDGSKAYLNSGSSIRFSNQMAQSEQRRIELTGEAYFDVAKDPKHPFIVKAGTLEVRALGTEFNVDAYNPAESINVILLEGKVSISQADQEHNETLMILTPNEMARYQAKQNSISKERTYEPEKYIGWIEGKMVFVDDPIRDVIRKLANCYNVDIRLEDKQLEKYRFTGTFMNESVEEVLHTFSQTSPLTYDIIPARKDSQGRYTKRIIKLKMN